jgi:hypothetical protein
MEMYAVNQEKQPEVKQVVVRIDVHMVPELDDGSYSQRVLASPDPSFARPGDHIKWVSSHPFTIRYDHATPLLQRNEVHSSSGARGGHEAEARIRGDAQRVEPYKYTIALMLEDLEQVIIADPSTVVEPDPPPR